MDVFDAIKGRRSVRRFRPEPIPNELLYLILDAARWAPSPGNVQSWEFIIVKDKEKINQISTACPRQDFIKTAPCLIVVCSDTERIGLKFGKRGKFLFSIQETAAAAQNILLSAFALGLSTCWVGQFLEQDVKEILGLPQAVVPYVIIPIGYPLGSVHTPDRVNLTNFVHFEKFGNFDDQYFKGDQKIILKKDTKEKKEEKKDFGIFKKN
jgi:nitroreductase